LRDLAGLIVIDFIDMDEGRNNRAVERKLKEALKSDRARIQVGRISHFGLMEMSRQRIRSSVLESSTEVCPHCGGTGHVRAVSSVALQLVRAVEETLLKGATHNLIVRSRSDVAIYVLNHKRAHLRMLEERFKIAVAVTVDETLTGHPSFSIDRGEQVMSLDQAKAIAATIRPDSIPAYAGEDEAETDEVLDELEAEGEEAAEPGEDARERGRRKRRRGRRGRGREGEPREPVESPGLVAAGPADEEMPETGDAEAEDAESDAAFAAANGEGERRRRRRGRRGGRRNRRDREGEGEGEEGQEIEVAVAAGEPDTGQDEPPAHAAEASEAAPPPAEPAASPAPVPVDAPAPEPVAEQPVRRRSTIREAPPAVSAAEDTAPLYVPPSPPARVEAEQPLPAEASDKPRRKGWWSMRG
jgi:ribonuclease E